MASNPGRSSRDSPTTPAPHQTPVTVVKVKTKLCLGLSQPEH